MKITFNTPINEGDTMRTGVTCDHLIFHFPQAQVVSNNVGAPPKTLPMDGLRDETKAALDAAFALLAEDFRGEYEEGAVTARVVAKREAAQQETAKDATITTTSLEAK